MLIYEKMVSVNFILRFNPRNNLLPPEHVILIHSLSADISKLRNLGWRSRKYLSLTFDSSQIVSQSEY